MYARPSTLREASRRGHFLSGARRGCAPPSRQQTGTTGAMATDFQSDDGNYAKHGRMERANGALFAIPTLRAKGAIRKRAHLMATVKLCCGTAEDGLVSELGAL